MKKTVTEEVKTYIEELQNQKYSALETLQKKLLDYEDERNEADRAMNDAAAEMDIDAYEEAGKAKRKAQIAIDMYNAKLDQLRKQELITEDESDQVIDRLLDYETQLADDFKTAAAEPLKTLAELLAAYKTEVREVESTLNEWQCEIHANYKTRGLTLFYDNLTGTQTDRGPHPVPVHNTAYTGCVEANQLSEYLEKAKALIPTE